MPRPSHLFAPPVSGLVVPVRVDSRGVTGPTKPQSRGPNWRRTSPGCFVSVEVSDEYVEQRILEAWCRAGPRAVVTGWAALRLWGGGYFDGLARDGVTRLPVPIATNGERLQHHAGILASRFAVPPDEVEVIHGIRCASVERSLFDEMRRVHHVRAMVVPADMTFAAELTSIGRMRRYRLERRWYRDVRTVDDALDLCDENAWSPYEVDFRLVWRCDAGWPHPLCNRSVLDLEGRLSPYRTCSTPCAGSPGSSPAPIIAMASNTRATSFAKPPCVTSAWSTSRPRALTSGTSRAWSAASTRQSGGPAPARCRDVGSSAHPPPRPWMSCWTPGTVERRESAVPAPISQHFHVTRREMAATETATERSSRSSEPAGHGGWLPRRRGRRRVTRRRRRGTRRH